MALEILHPLRIRALIFDLDGTLYTQGPVRRRMFQRLLAAHWNQPIQGLRTLRALQSYRRAQEHLRDSPKDPVDLAASQLLAACRECGMDRNALAQLVDHWMDRNPLDLLLAARKEGVVEILELGRRRGWKLAVLSDYPADQKLAAMGIREYFDAVVCAQDPAVGRFKPDPRGLLETLRRIEVEAGEALYIGDRAEVDGEAASRAGMACAVIGAPGRRKHAANLVAVSTFHDLSRILTAEAV